MKEKDAHQTCGDMSGSEFNHLGHFRKKEFLNQGHNQTYDMGSKWPEDSGPGMIQRARKLDQQAQDYSEKVKPYNEVFGSFTQRQRDQTKALDLEMNLKEEEAQMLRERARRTKNNPAIER